MPPAVPSIKTSGNVSRKHSLDDGDASPTNKKPKRSSNSDSPFSSQITAKAEVMLKSIPNMRQTIEGIYSRKIGDSDFVLNGWHTACTKGKYQEDNWTSDERELLNVRLPKDAYFSETYNRMYEDFSQKPQGGVKAAERVLDSIPNMRQMITAKYNNKKAVYMHTFNRWTLACEAVRDGTPGLPPPDVLLPNDLDFEDFELCNAKYQFFAQFVRLHVNSLLPPSDFGKDGRWGEEQRKEGRIYCLRPQHVRSLPLCIFHDVFRQYLLDIERPLPLASDTAIAAQRIAAKLCAKMGMSVSKNNKSAIAHRSRDDKENKRTKEFDACISDFLGKVSPMYILKAASDENSGIADGVLLKDGILIALLEMKAEPGANGDAYMQVARCYDLAVKALQEGPSADAFLRQGAPMFLLCVVGPMIKVSGGFYDGKKVIVEPLTAFCDMLEDPLNERQNKVARVLFALRKGIDKLEALAQNKQLPPSFPPSTPRIYSSCTLCARQNPPNDTIPSGSLQRHLKFEGKGHLEFHQVVMSNLLLQHNSLLFIGALSGTGPPFEVFVKLAREYGDDVHQLLEEENLAPKLYAKSEVEGASTAYIMEYLEPSSWQTLHYHSLAMQSGDSDYKEPVRLSMDKVLTILRKNKVVHGDLRSTNIMVQVSPGTGKLVCVDDEGSQRASIRVIDFDWSGEAGKVHYPPTRNEDIRGITWPGKPGYLIEQDHDKQLFESWWPNLGEEVEIGLQSDVFEV